MKIFIKKQQSKQGKQYTCAYIDLGYKVKYIAVGTMECAELANMLPQELETRLKKDEVIIL